MGVVKRQGIKQSVVTYASMVIGAVNLVFLYPAALSKDEIGIINFVRDSAVLLSPFLFWGSTELIVRYFPTFRDEKKHHHGYLFFLHLIFVLGILTLTAIYFLFHREFQDYFAGKSPLFLEYLPFVFPIVLLLTYAAIFTSYASNFHRITVPAIFNELVPKVGMLMLTLAFFFNLIIFQGIFWGQVAFYSLIVVAQVWYVANLGQLNLRPNFTFLKKSLLKDVTVFGLYGLVGSLGSRIGERINTVMLGTIATLGDTGVYTVAFFISDAIDAPRRAISRISAPLLSDKWKHGKMNEIEEIYQKSSLNQLIVGLGLLLAVWVSVDEIFQIMPNGEVFSQGKYVILVLGIARVIDMLTGVNTEIISYSGFYKYNFYLIILLALTNIGFNFWLIPVFTINGAALATLASLTLYNLLKFIIIWRKLKMQPFSWQIAGVLAIGALAYIACAWIPNYGFPLLGLALKSSLSLLIFGVAILYFQLSPDMNQVVVSALKKLKKCFGI